MVRFLVLPTLLSAATAFSLSSGSKPEISVWDDVLPIEDQRDALHAYAARSGLEHKCFSRPLAAAADGNHRNNNIIERALDAILTEIEDGTDDGAKSRQYVEYWTRQEWRHIEAHADVDENLSKRTDRNPPGDDDDDDDGDLRSEYATTYRSAHGHRYPTHGHVLYLQVGSDVKGPTCVFPRRSSGGDLLRSSSTTNKDNDLAGNAKKGTSPMTARTKGM